MLQANKRKTYKIKESEAHLYHVELLTRTDDPVNKRYIDHRNVQMFDGKGFQQFKKFKPAGILEVEILHDPTFKEKEQKGTAKQ